MNNPFFKNKGPFKIDKLLKLASVANKKMADAQWSATIVDRK